jgi:hypothetical protein
MLDSLSLPPDFDVRRFSVLVFQGPFWRHYDQQASLLQGLKYVRDQVIPAAKKYNIGSVEFTGRPGEGMDPDWLIRYKDYPKIESHYHSSFRDWRAAYSAFHITFVYMLVVAIAYVVFPEIFISVFIPKSRSRRDPCDR